MERSFYGDIVKKYFPSIVLRTVERLNEKDVNIPVSYKFKELLTPTLSVDGRWATLIGEYTRVAADIVAMDSSLPIKKRDKLEKATGEIPKLGMEMNLNEKQMSDIDTMIAMNYPIEDIVSKILSDVPRVIEGVYERNELMFLQGLSTGVALVAEGDPVNDNIGTDVLVDYGFLSENKFGASAAGLVNIVDDIRKIKNKARVDGNSIIRAYTDEDTFLNIIQTAQFKEYFAFNKGFVGANIAIPTIEQANEVFSSLFGLTFVMVDRIVKTERDGVRKAVNPWQKGMVTFTSDIVVGNLVYSRLAEMNRPVKDVTYQTVDSYILVSKYATVRPSFAEFTTSQARCLPVITNVDRIYTLDTTVIQS